MYLLNCLNCLTYLSFQCGICITVLYFTLMVALVENQSGLNYTSPSGNQRFFVHFYRHFSKQIKLSCNGNNLSLAFSDKEPWNVVFPSNDK